MKAIRFLSEQQMSKLTTPRLLAYKNRLHQVVEGPNYEVLYEGALDTAQHKQRAEWRATMDACKAVLATREHSPRKPRGPRL